MTVLHACVDLYCKQVFYITNIAVYICTVFLDGIGCSWAIRGLTD